MEHTAAGAASARRWGWAILLITGAISLVFNVAHALEAAAAAHLHAGLGVLYGVAPVLVALMLSHLIGVQQSGRGKRIVTGLVFVAALSLSVSAIAAVLWPIAGYGSYVFAIMLDVAALMGLGEVLGASRAAGPGTQEGPQQPPVPDVPEEPPAGPDDEVRTRDEDTVPMHVLVSVPAAPAVPAAVARPAPEPFALPDVPEDLQQRAEEEFAGELAAGRVPSIREIKRRLSVGQANASLVKAHLEDALAQRSTALCSA